MSSTPPVDTAVPITPETDGSRGTKRKPAVRGRNEVEEEDDSNPCFWLLVSLILGTVIGIFALIPLCVLKGLKNRKNRKFYIIGLIPTVIINLIIVVLAILFGLTIIGTTAVAASQA